ncbi:hypothetical protein [Streptomyces sp. CBMA156]|uniref:hypothetical protein n=1 Tax=Streptomyces sp. CBMA156 TaxID=1930280 RepID=UPI001661DF60|nr:hypothetical protein [Streptomyces sp. CBMA156]MBD0670208.1 hypothetical protein [Streptomyces sp. CBMA156]
MSWLAVRSGAEEWVRGRLAAQQQRVDLVTATRSARELVRLVGVDAADRVAFAPVRTAIERRIGVERHFYYHWRSPWLVPLAVPPFLVLFGGRPRVAATMTALLWTALVGRMLIARYRAAKYRVATVLGLLLTIYLWFIVPIQHGNSDAPWHLPEIAQVALALLLSIEIPLLGFGWLYYRSRVDEGCHAYDRLVVRTVEVAHRFHQERAAWRSAGTCRSWTRDIDSLAVDAARCLALPERTDTADWRLRAELRVEAERIAEGIRLLKADLVRARCEEDVSEVVASLARGMLLVAGFDRTALLATAPPAPTPPGLLARLGTRLAPAIVLLLAAWLVPMIPMVADRPGVAQAAMWSLMISAGTVLATANSEVRNRIQDAVAKTLPPV